MRVELVKRFLDEMPEGDDDQNKAEGNQSLAGAQAENDQSAGHEFYYRYHGADSP